MAAGKLTPALGAAIAQRIAAGAPLTDAARAEGIHPQTAKGWQRRGREESTGIYSDFAAAVDQARADAADRPEPVTQDEFRRRLEDAVRAGSVNAMSLWARLYHDADEAPEEPSTMVDLLAERRKRRGAT